MAKTTKVETTPPVSMTITPDPPTPSNIAIHSFNPLEEAVNEKTYSGQGVPQAQAGDIPEHTFNSAPVEDEFNDIPEKQHTKSEKKQAEEKKKEVVGNPDMQGASDKERQEGAAVLTDVILTTWEQGYKRLNQFFKISEKQVNKLQAAGQIDTRVEVPYKMGMAPMSTVFTDYNNDADGLLILEPEFKEEVHPLITEELAKAGHGMSNRQKLMYLIGTKLLADGMKAYEFIQLKSSYLKFAKEHTSRYGNVPVTTTTSAPVQQAAKEEVVTQQATTEEVITNDGEDYIDTSHMTLQEAAMARMMPGGVNNTAPGRSRNQSRVNRTTKKVEKAVSETRTSKQKAKAHIEAAKVTPQNDPPPTSKKVGKKGRPPGSKNKKK